LSPKNDDAYAFGERMQISMSWSKEKKVDTAGIAIYTSTGQCVFATNTAIDRFLLSKSNSVKYTVDLELGEGEYFVMAGTFVGKNNEIVDFISQGPDFTISGAGDGIKGEGVARLRHAWERE
jgi:hypothetical protein